MIRAVNLCRQLEKENSVTFLAVSQDFNQDSVSFCSHEFEHFKQIHLQSYSDYPRIFSKLLLKWHMHWPYTQGIQASEKDQRYFRELVNSHDVVWFHTLGAAFPFKVNQIPNSVMDLDDLNQCKYEQLSQIQPTLRLRLSAKVQAYKWKRHERNAFSRFNRIVVCSEKDKTFLKGGTNTSVIPNGYVMPETEPQWSPPDPHKIGFIGLLDYAPNRDGLIWFRDTVWPIIRRHNPKMRLRIIGKKPLQKNHVDGDGFEYTGFLEDTTEEMKSWSSLIVPITYGGGTRIKILDAFSKKCPVIATPIGAFGVDAVHGEHILLSSDSEEFAGYCLELSSSPERAKSLVERGWELFVKKYSWGVIGDSIRELIENITFKS